MSSLMVFNKSAVPVVLTGLGITVPASADPPLRGPGVNVTSKLKNLTKAQFLSLETQRQSTGLDYSWTEAAEFDTGALQVQTPALLRNKGRKNAWQGVMTKGDEILIAVCNACERVSDGDAATVARILEIYTKRFVCPAWGMRAPEVKFYSDWSLVPTDSRTFVLLLLNEALPDDDGELGLHDQVKNRVIGRVSCESILNNGGGITGVDVTAWGSGAGLFAPMVQPSVTSVACHELVEFLFDAYINQWTVGPRWTGAGFEYPYPAPPYGNFEGTGTNEIAMWFKEPADSVEAYGFYLYDELHGTDIYGGLQLVPLGLVSNFALPSWYNVRSPFYVPDQPGVKARCIMNCVPGSQLVDGDYIEFTQPGNFAYGEMPSKVTLKFTNDPEPPFPPYPADPEVGVEIMCHIPFTSTTTVYDIAVHIFGAVDGSIPSNIYNTALDYPEWEGSSPDVITLVTYFTGEAYNVPVTEAVVDAAFTTTDFTGGATEVYGVFVPTDFLGILPGPFVIAPGGYNFILQGDNVEYVLENRASMKDKKGWPAGCSSLMQINGTKFKHRGVRINQTGTLAKSLQEPFSGNSRRVDSNSLRTRTTVRTLT
jgi:hypothetical protein